jgi:hypothetical protein
LHASAVALKHRCAIFVGETFSGKTTLFTEAVLSADALPVANDRVSIDAALRVHSWPSYASYCEGTLLRYPPLHAAALDYERDSCAFRTRRWSAPVSNSFSIHQKRIYPMGWFAAAAGRKYQRAAPLAAIVLPRVSKDALSLSIRAVGREALLDRLEASSFESREPSFLPWHGLSRPPASATSALVANVLESGVPAFELELRPSELGKVGHLLQEMVS